MHYNKMNIVVRNMDKAINFKLFTLLFLNFLLKKCSITFLNPYILTLIDKISLCI